MRNFRLSTVALAAIAASLPVSASAASLLFSFQGGQRSFSFTIEDTRLPDRTNTFLGARIFYDNLPGTFNGVSSSATAAQTVTFGISPYAPISVSAPGFGFGNFGGPALFNGSVTNPVFNLGTFNLSQVNTGPGTGGGVLTISQVPGGAVPEPATWAMLVLGFGVAGMALRRRRHRVAFTIA